MSTTASKSKKAWDVEDLVAECARSGMLNVLAAVERDVITHALEASNGNCNLASKLLRVQRTTLVEKRRKMGMVARRKKAAT